MNWNKVMNVFILLFLVLNVALFLYQWQYEDERYTLSSDRETMLTKILGREGVTIYNWIPKFEPMETIVLGEPVKDKERIIETIIGDQYTIEPDEFNLGEKVSDGEQTLIFYFGEQEGYIYYSSETGHYVPENLTKNSVEKVAKQFAEDLYGEDVVMETTLDTQIKDDNDVPLGYRIEMNEIYARDQRQIFQSFIKLYVTEDGIQEALAVRYPPIELGSEVKDIHAFDVVMYNLMYYLSEELEELRSEGVTKTIKEIDVGYYLQDVDTKKLTYELEPHYRVVFIDGDTYYINAYTNVITKP